MLRSPAAMTIAYLIAALMPWLILDRQEAVRYSQSPDRLWPAWTIYTLLHMAVLGFVIWQNLWRPAPALEQAPAPISAKRWKCAAAGLVFAVLVAAIWPSFLYYLDKVWLDPPSVAEADMIPLVESSLRDFWIFHLNPYHAHEVANWWSTLTFLPGLWMPYSIPYAASVDIRTWCMGGLIGASVLLFAGALARASRASHPATALACLPALVAPFYLFLAPTFRGFLPIMHLGGYWLIVVLWALTLRGRSYFVAGALFALAVLSRPYMAVLVPFYGAWSFWKWREHRGAVLRTWAGMFVLGVPLCLPFLAADPKMFLGGFLHGYDAQLTYHVESEPWRTHGYSLSGLLFQMDAFGLRNQLAIIGEATLLVLTCTRLRTERALLLVSSAALFFFLSLTIIPWYYVFVTPLLILALASPEFGADVSRHAFASRRVKLLVALACVGIVGAAVLYPIYRPRESLGFNALDGNDRLLQSKELQRGFDAFGWVENAGAKPRRVTASDAFFSIPTRDLRNQTLALDIESSAPPAESFIDLYANFEFIGSLRLEPGRHTTRFVLPRKCLFVGGNQVRFRLREGTVVGDAALPDKLDIRLWKAELLPYSPLQ